jgi:hypothetical protein
MKTRPILFQGAMVRALLNGSKTQTRRLFKLPSGHRWDELQGGMPSGNIECDKWPGTWHLSEFPSPYGQPGDQLWVRESGLEHKKTQLFIHDATPGRWWTSKDGGRYGASYSADIPRSDFLRDHRVRPSIHMPRWASRITLEITGVRVERLQQISEVDALSEGITSLRSKEWDAANFPTYCNALNAATDLGEKPPVGPLPSAVFAALWSQINGPESWASNPWVWVIEFKVVK